jgi:hypothetical protein
VPLARGAKYSLRFAAAKERPPAGVASAEGARRRCERRSIYPCSRRDDRLVDDLG